MVARSLSASPHGLLYSAAWLPHKLVRFQEWLFEITESKGSQSFDTWSGHWHSIIYAVFFESKQSQSLFSFKRMDTLQFSMGGVPIYLWPSLIYHNLPVYWVLLKLSKTLSVFAITKPLSVFYRNMEDASLSCQFFVTWCHSHRAIWWVPRVSHRTFSFCQGVKPNLYCWTRVMDKIDCPPPPIFYSTVPMPTKYSTFRIPSPPLNQFPSTLH